MRPQARYFPVSSAPLKMVAGLRRLSAEPEAERGFFQVDEQRPAYLAAKRRAPAERHGLFGTDAAAESARTHALAWMHETLAREHPSVLADARADGEARDELDALARVLQEDFAVLSAGEHDQGRTVALDVRFPSGWRPERLAGASFAALHQPVPDFVVNTPAAQSMVRAMVERGPYVRFVWTLCTDDELDHHPDVRRVEPWETADALWLRVERQVTVPLPAAHAALFLIRTYVYPCASLDDEQRHTVGRALACMPPEVRAYKGLPQQAQVRALLDGARAEGWKKLIRIG